MPVTLGAHPTEINFDPSALTPDPGKVFAAYIGGAPYPDPNNPEATVRDLGAEVLNFGGINVQSGTSYALQASDQGKIVVFTNAAAVAVTLPSTLAAKFSCWVLFLGTGGTLTPSSGTINSVASLSVSQNGGGFLSFDGTNWADVTAETPSGGSGGAVMNVVEVSLSPSAPGNFTVPHGLGAKPAFVIIQMTSGGEIWLQTPTSFDATNLYLIASDAGITATAIVFPVRSDAEIFLVPSAAGNFTVPHGLGVTPTLALIEMLSGGEIWFQSLGWDATNLYLVASDAGIRGYAEVFLNAPSLAATLPFAQVPLSPSGPGNFTVAHGLGQTPSIVIVRMTSGGAIWLQTPTGFDSTNLYLTASDGGITGVAEIWVGESGGSSTLAAPLEIALAPSSPGNFKVAHGLSSKPKVVLLQMTSGGQIWFQATRYDATYIYLVASDAGVTGYAEVWT